MHMWTAMRVSLPPILPCSNTPQHTTPFSHWLLASAVCGFRLLPPSPSLSSVAPIFQIRDETRHMTIQVMLMSTWLQQPEGEETHTQAQCTHTHRTLHFALALLPPLSHTRSRKYCHPPRFPPTPAPDAQSFRVRGAWPSP